MKVTRVGGKVTVIQISDAEASKLLRQAIENHLSEKLTDFEYDNLDQGYTQFNFKSSAPETTEEEIAV